MLMIGIYDRPISPTAQMLLDVTPYITAANYSTNLHGFEALNVTARVNFIAAAVMYNTPAVLYVAVTYNGRVVWEGRIEAPGILVDTNGAGITFTAFGSWRAMMDTRYTALWSATNVDWRILQPIDRADAFPDRFATSIDTGALRIVPKKNEVFGSTGGFKVCWALWAIPSGSTRNVTRLSFDWRLQGSAAWRVEMRPDNDVPLFIKTGNDALQTGSESITISPSTQSLRILFFNVNPDATYVGETGNVYFEIRNVRITTDSTPIDAGAIARALVASVAQLNPMQLSTSVAGIQATGLDLTNEIYVDETPVDILVRLAERGDTQSRRWRVGVWENQTLFFQPDGATNGRTWYVDVASIDTRRSLDSAYNSVYAVYQDANDNEVRTPAATNTISAARLGVIRQAAQEAKTTSAVTATVIRDTALADQAMPRNQASITLSAVEDAYGARYPLCLVRALDTMVIRNLPVSSANDEIDRVRTFRIARTSYDLMTDTLTVEPEVPPARLAAMLARAASR